MLLALAGGLRLEASTVAGDVTSEVTARSEGGPGRRVLVVGEGRPTLTVRSMSGDVTRSRHRPLIARRRRAAAAAAARRPPTTPAEDSPTVVVDHAEPPHDDDAARLAILRALEAGEIDVAEAGRRLEALEAST